MHLKVGPFVYRVVFVEGFVEHEGAACLGLADHERHVITVSRAVSESQQVQVICHEYMEAWVYHFAADLADDAPQKERWCDLFGSAMTQFVMDLVRTLRESGADGGEALGGASVRSTEGAAEKVPEGAGLRSTKRRGPGGRAIVGGADVGEVAEHSSAGEGGATEAREAALRAAVMDALRRASDGGE
jgi:hypothetical protein